MADREHSHGHAHEANISDGALVWAVMLNLGLSAFEFVAGLIAGSVALLADALHNTNDALALLVALVARRVSRRGADRRFTFGYRRAELIGAVIQLTALILVAVFLIIEAMKRFFTPEPVAGGWMMGAAAVALVVDLGTVLLLWAMSRGSMNVKAAFLHNLTDAGASLAVLAGGATVHWLSWHWVDPVLTLGIAGSILWMSIGMLRGTARILMEGAPRELDLGKLQNRLCSVDPVEDVHHLHVWELDEQNRAMEAHIVVRKGAGPELRRHLKEILASEFHIRHSTLELESVEDACQGDAGALIPKH